MKPERKVHVVARGAVSGFGVGHDTLIDAVFAGATSVRPLERLAGTECLTSVAAEVPAALRAAVDDDCALPQHIAELAAREALSRWTQRPDARTLFCFSSTKADLSGIVTPTGDGLGNPKVLAGRLQRSLELEGPVVAISCACASGLSALAYAGRQIRAGVVDHALVLGVDTIYPFILRGFSALLALDPDGARPFDRDRRGLSVGDGAAAIVLSATPNPDLPFELTGWGESNDANHVTGPCRDGSGLALAIDRALASARIEAARIDYVHMHGTGTPYNDAMESRAIERTFASPPRAGGSKGQIGHTLGAAGLLESLIAIAGLERQTVPPNPGLAQTDPDCAITIDAAPQRLERGDSVLKLAAGFGGINAALVFQRTTASQERTPRAPTPPIATPRASAVDAHGYRTTAGRAQRFADLDLDPVHGRVSDRAIFDRSHAGFRRMERTAKLFWITAELCDLQTLPEDVRANTAIVVASSTGCLGADLRFEASLHVDKGIEPGVFPYTLPSTVLGEIAIAHQLRGPALCLPVLAGEETDALALAAELFDHGEAAAVLVLLGDWFAGTGQIAEKTELLALLLTPCGPDTSEPSVASDVASLVARAKGAEDPIAALRDALLPD